MVCGKLKCKKAMESRGSPSVLRQDMDVTKHYISDEEFEERMTLFEKQWSIRYENHWSVHKAMAEDIFGKDKYNWEKIWEMAEKDEDARTMRELLQKYLKRM